jgi:hypothetical protein
MRGAIITLVLALTLFVSGCCFAPPPSTNQTNKTAGDTMQKPGDTMEKPGDSMEKPGDSTEQPGDTGAPSQPSAPTQPSGDSFEGKDWAGLMALGVPTQCNVASSGTTMKMYMVDGGKKVRVETASDDCPMNIIIMKNDKMYMACVGGESMMPNCDWIEFDISGSGSPGGAPGGSSPSDFEDAPASSFDCQAWIPDASKFETPGKVCNLQDMYGQ